MGNHRNRPTLVRDEKSRKRRSGFESKPMRGRQDPQGRERERERCRLLQGSNGSPSSSPSEVKIGQTVGASCV
ncbi:hypothetical protein EUGRSUZ_K01339 [Eucalyptus grandis]|uniref:Uncharacterized protein n=2 Tax=Eucalyptus grandis TaxID=71139 RepID=A0ACC3ITM6_EUCGR|nr:hypothetical protein EUGRSUZ_K01339 [Eucalyptus grandis]